ncbi:hypothetical protein FQR65_LT09515 [Abscondita terminalis]|nr:hypothetical protein FQR65_LT09515 [Abscondita terminalis]
MDSNTDQVPDTSSKRRSIIVYEDSSSDSSIENSTTKRKPKYYIQESDSESDSVSSIEFQKRKRIGRLNSDSSDSSDSSEVVRRVRKSAKIELDDEDSSEWETCNVQDANEPSTSKAIEESSSESSDGESEKCPICLLSFKNQEVGSPEACDHSFCSECIQEWAKSVNTCPVDRKKFNLILVRSNYNGKYLRSIDIQDPSTNTLGDILEQEIDFTPCEICGSSHNEDRLLLCDGCDLAYHLECLDPPLAEVPDGEWYCSNCVIRDVGIEIYNLNFFLGGEESDATLNTNRHYATPRLVPRTRQNERIRTRIVNQREQNENTDPEPSTLQPGPSSSNRNNTTNRRKKYKKKKCKKSRKRPKYKIIYDIDEATGEKIAIKKSIRKYRKRKTRRKKRKLKVRRVVVPKSVKNRLARQLGICPPQIAGQKIPEMKVQINSGHIGPQRIQAGIPSLDLFGRRDELDYFSESDADIEAQGVNIIIGRRPNRSDASVLRRANRNKAAILSQQNPAASVDLLGSILDNQTKLHSRNSIISVRSDGTLKIDVNKKVPSDKPVVIRNQKLKIRQTPTEPNTSHGGTANTSNSNSNQYKGESTYTNYESSLPTSTVGCSDNSENNRFGGNDDRDSPQDYSLHNLRDSLPHKEKNTKEKNQDNVNDEDYAGGSSESELDIYSDIETVSTSKVEDINVKCPSPASSQVASIMNLNTPDDDNESDTDLVIDTEKTDPDKYDPEAAFESDENEKEETVTSTSESVTVTTKHSDFSHSDQNAEIQSETVQSSNESLSENKTLEHRADDLNDDHDDLDEADELEDDCPNFNIYSSESINLAKTTDANIILSTSENETIISNDNLQPTEKESEPPSATVSKPVIKNKKSNLGLYSDSEDETVVKFTPQKPFGIGDISNMTEDISEEERSFTPCLDEKEPIREGLEGLDTEMISDDDKNDFEESQEQELKTVSDGDALEINAKESELDFSRPEECEEGEIVDKLKSKTDEVANAVEEVSPIIDSPEKDNNKENEDLNKEPIFKKLSKSNKDRNYRDKDNKERSKSKDKRDKTNKDNKKDRRKEKRREIERYDVRSIVEAKPKRDKFGRDPTRRRSYSSSKSNSPPRRFGRDEGPRRSISRKSATPERIRKRRRSPSRSRSRGRKRSRSKQRKRKSISRERRHSGRKSADRSKRKTKKRKSRSRTPPRKRDWDRRQSRGWTPSLSRSRSPEHRHFTPSWTPPRMMNQVRPQNLTVILPNVSNKKRKEKRKERNKKTKEANDKQVKKRRRNERSPPPSKEVFASGNNILVSVSFNKDNEERDERSKRRRDGGEELTTKRMRKDKEKQTKKPRRRVKNTSNIKPVAIIDLDRSPFKELTPSPKDVIVLTDSENGDSNDAINMQKSHRRESTEQPPTAERNSNANYISSTGPKTPPEPQVKFTFTSKPTQLRAINNPLHEPQEEEEIDPQEELENRLNEVMHKGPNTPPEPPNSPPSSPDAYDPFDPTKSRTPTPEPVEVNAQSNTAQSIEDTQEDLVDRSSIIDITEKESPTAVTVSKSHTPPIPAADIQPADSQSSIRAITPDTNIGSSPERPIGVVINQLVQPQTSIFPTVVSKSVAPIVYSSGSTSLITSTPVSSNLNVPRISLNSSSIPTPTVTSTVSQRIILPTAAKLSPINKVSPTKVPAKMTPVKPMPSNKIPSKPVWKSKSKSNENNDTNLDFDSPYSPGSSDYEDLFEPPPEVIKSVGKTAQNTKNAKSPNKTQNAFDALFGSSPVYANRNKAKQIAKPKKHLGRGTKQVGVKLDEDNLKILDELPNSAVEMQVKDKFLKKLNRQERVVEEVKFVLKPYYNKKRVSKEEYKDILRKAVPKICHNKSGEINPKKIQRLVEAYVKRIRHSKKVTSSSSINPQKT